MGDVHINRQMSINGAFCNSKSLQKGTSSTSVVPPNKSSWLAAGRGNKEVRTDRSQRGATITNH